MSLSEKLAVLATPEPIFQVPDDEIDLETTAKVVDYYANDDKDVSGAKSTLRLKNLPILADSDSRYAGKKTSRKDLEKELSIEGRRTLADEDGESLFEDTASESGSKEDGLTSEEEEDETGEEEEEKHLEIEDEEEEQFKTDNFNDEELVQKFREHFKDNFDGEQSSEESDTDEDEQDDEGSSDVGIDGLTGKLNGSSVELSTDTIKTFSERHSDDEIEKGLAVKAQLKLWDSLLECRIKLQKVMLGINQLPQFDVWPLFVAKGGEAFKEPAKINKEALKRLLDQLVQLQTVLLMNNAETRHILTSGNNRTPKEESDEEIPSDSEKEMENAETSTTPANLKRKLPISDYPEFLSKRHASFEPYRNATLQKWSDKTTLSTGRLKTSFASFEQSPLMQIEQILSDRDRLIRRTQLKRSNYQLLGKKFSLQMEDDQGGKVSGQEAVLKQDFHLKDVDVEIFDDNDFYHQLLRELIERKTVDMQDPLALGRQWLEIQKLRSKMKKKATIGASKERSIRYDVHPKLVNFMAPVDNVTMPEEARNDLFGSLFGTKSQSTAE